MSEHNLVEQRNDRPIIGILSQEISYELEKIYKKGTFKCFIAASYVKFIEGSGGRVVPLLIGKDEMYYKGIMENINGILFPGGATWFDNKDGYADAGRYILTIAKKFNEKGIYFPIWGTCLGMELFAYLWLDPPIESFRSNCEGKNQASNIEFVEGFQNSKMYGSLEEDVKLTLKDTNSTYNYHQFCLTDETLKNCKMSEDWKILSYSRDTKDSKHVSSMEAKNYPFYGVQFHPEKCSFEWVEEKNIPHSAEAIKANRYFADFFVNECRKNNQRFPDKDMELQNLIFNFTITYTKIKGSIYEQCYFF